MSCAHNWQLRATPEAEAVAGTPFEVTYQYCVRCFLDRFELTLEVLSPVMGMVPAVRLTHAPGGMLTLALNVGYVPRPMSDWTYYALVSHFDSGVGSFFCGDGFNCSPINRATESWLAPPVH